MNLHIGLFSVPKNSLALCSARQKTYKYSTEIYIPNDPYEKVEAGYELSDRMKTSGSPIACSKEKFERSRWRSNATLIDSILRSVLKLISTLEIGREDQKVILVTTIVAIAFFIILKWRHSG